MAVPLTCVHVLDAEKSSGLGFIDALPGSWRCLVLTVFIAFYCSSSVVHRLDSFRVTSWKKFSLPELSLYGVSATSSLKGSLK